MLKFRGVEDFAKSLLNVEKYPSYYFVRGVFILYFRALKWL